MGAVLPLIRIRKVMATFTTINEIVDNEAADQFLVRQNGIDYKIKKEHLAAGIANARWIATTNYDKGSEIIGSDGTRYKAVQDSGVSSTVSDPVGDATRTYWTPVVVSAMSRVEFEANQQQNISSTNGSGNIEMGKHYVGNASSQPINQGLWAYGQEAGANGTNRLTFGRTNSPVGTSRTEYPIIQMNGVRHHVKNIGSNVYGNLGEILFAPAEDGSRVVDLTKTPSITKHADANAAFAYAEPLKKYITQTYADTWLRGSSTPSNVAVSSDGSFSFSNTGSKYSNFAIQLDMAVGETYTVTVDVECTSGSSNFRMGFVADNHSPDTPELGIFNQSMSAGTRLRLTRDISCTGASLSLGAQNYASYGFTVHSITVVHTTAKVLTSRQDLAVWEQHYEVIGTGAGEKDVVYPLGLIQNGSTSYKGISLVDTTSLGIGAGYAKFGDWQSDGDVISKGAKWSTLTQGQKNTFLSDLDNNIFEDPITGKLVQVRLKARTIRGLDNDWINVRDSKSYLGHSTLNRVKPKGQLTTITADLANWPDNETGYYINHIYESKDLKAIGVGAWNSINKANNDVDTGLAWEGKCYAMPICLVQRHSQAAYHVTHAPHGTAQVQGYSHWYRGANITSTLDAFNFATLGNIASTYSGRHDQYPYYDAIYEGMVQDLRLHAYEKDQNRSLEEAIQGYIGGTARGKSRVPTLEAVFTGTVGTVENYGRMRLDSSHQNLAASLNVGLDTSIASADSCVHLYNETQDKWSLVAIIHSANGIYLFGEEDHIAIDTTQAQPWEGCEIPTSGYQRSINNMINGVSAADGLNYYASDSRVGTGGVVAVGDTVHFIKHNVTSSSEEYDELPYTAILGKVQSIKTALYAMGGRGITGQWIPDVRTGYFAREVPLKIDQSTNADMVYSDDGGVTWVKTDNPVDPITNSLLNLNITASRILIANMSSLSATTQPTNQLGLIDKPLGVYAGCFYSNDNGARLCSSLTTEVPTNSEYASGGGVRARLPITKDYVRTSDSKLDTDTRYGKIFHEPSQFGAPNNSSIGFKTSYSVVEENGLKYLQFNYKRLQYNSTVLTLNAVAMTDSMLSVENGKFIKMVEGPLAGMYRMEQSITNNIWQNSYDVHSLALDIKGNIVYTPNGTTVATKVSPYGWGDDDTIAISDRDNASIDLNNNRQTTGTHRSKFPIGIA